MPFAVLLPLAAGGAGGFFLGKGTQSISNAFKWAAVAGAVYLIATKVK